MKLLGSSLLSGDGVKARSLRGAGLTMLSFGGSKILSLGSSLILTRLLFPEAFGMMVLVQIFITGLKMFSDTGIRTSIIQSKRGDDPDFLNTAWTIQIFRGCLLWLCTCALAWPAALLYNEPMLAQLLPIAGLSTLISGFATTNIATANRHLMLGRTTAIELGTQCVGIVLLGTLAYLLESVWALVIGSVTMSGVTVIVQHMVLPGIRNRLCWDKTSFLELFHFGKFLFLSTAATFMLTQGDKAILGGYVSLAELGIYNLGYFLGAVPFVFSKAMTGKIVMPLYRLKPISESAVNRKNIFKARRLIIACSLIAAAILAYTGIWFINFMYDPRFALAGPVVVLLSLTIVPRIVITSYGAVLLAAGDSRRFFILNFSTALLQTFFLFIGAIWFGIFGVLVAPAIAILMTNPLRIYFVRKYDGWDARGDMFFMSLGFAVNGFACWLHWDEIVKLM